MAGTDGSNTASEAVARAGELAKLVGATVHLVCAFRLLVGRSGSISGGETYDRAQSDALLVLEEAARRLQAIGVEVENHAVHGEAAGALLDAAEATRADLIVVGSKGMTGGRRYLLGSVPDKISHHALCNVLIVRTQG